MTAGQPRNDKRKIFPEAFGLNRERDLVAPSLKARADVKLTGLAGYRVDVRSCVIKRQSVLVNALHAPKFEREIVLLFQVSGYVCRFNSVRFELFGH